MNIIETDGLSYHGKISFTALQHIEKAKEICKGFNVVSDGILLYKVSLRIIKGCNEYNTCINLIDKEGYDVGYFLNGIFFSGYGRKIIFKF